ncbi:hypothetical protein UMM65_03605 [Aureibaculum sp. 2210JD6-5]|uniref:hypothetical protein n=1 Tax=Aureibaculum sp. 2210JD6-5 TaxID=3103957 RepID=UPI002AAC969D|nr:hypothetical protein [Aureibaculum sp. 2210JD6-5]MDY7394312.1 hypothetical protein [Aureibaculum sp. 2210JD6-5]
MNFNRKTTFFLLISLIIGILPPVVLYGLLIKKNNQKNGFERNFFIETPLTSSSKLDLKYPGYYISGYTNHNLFLNHIKAPGHTVMSNFLLSDTIHLNLDISISEETSNQMKWGRTKVSIDSPYVYMADGFSGNILVASLSDKKSKINTFKNLYFSEYVALTPSLTSTIFKSYDYDLKQNIIVKKTKDTANLLKFILKKQIDGLFCTDGVLLQTKEKSKRVIHIYKYRNQIVSLDTMLRKVYTSKTIDTVSFANIEVSNIKSGTQRTLSKKPLVVNRKSCVSNDYLFINLSLKADNEESSTFSENTVIDVYFNNSGKYISSFYIPKYENKKFQDFQVIGNTLCVLYDRYIMSYALSDVAKKILEVP